jgi:hypothetical protein
MSRVNFDDDVVMYCAVAVVGKCFDIGRSSRTSSGMDWEARSINGRLVRDLRHGRQVLQLHTRCYHCQLLRMGFPGSVHALGGLGSPPPWPGPALNVLLNPAI